MAQSLDIYIHSSLENLQIMVKPLLSAHTGRTEGSTVAVSTGSNKYEFGVSDADTVYIASRTLSSPKKAFSSTDPATLKALWTLSLDNRPLHSSRVRPSHLSGLDASPRMDLLLRGTVYVSSR